MPYYTGYIFYLFYKRIHPKYDIIGRILFLLNPKLKFHYPIITEEITPMETASEEFILTEL